MKERQELYEVLGYLFGFAFLAALGFLGFRACFYPGSEAGGGALSYGSLDFQMQCEQMVRDRLKAPASARFEVGSFNKVTGTTQSGYRLESYVDSENSFGALLRSYFVCSYDPHTQRVSLEFQPR